MASLSDWKVPTSVQPKPEDYSYDLERALSCVVALRATVPTDAYTAETLGTERAGNGVIIRSNGLILTIGYLITEADTIWLTLSDGQSVPGHVLGYDQETGFGLVQALAKLDMPALGSVSRRRFRLGERVVVAGAGGRQHSVAGAHRRQTGIRRLLGIRARRSDLHGAGASELGRHRDDRTRGRSARHRFAAAAERGRKGPPQNINMIVPIDLLKPIFDDLHKFGRRKRRRGHGSASTRPRSKTGSLSSGSPIADRRNARTCRPAMSYCRSRVPRSTIWQACSDASGRKARPASKCRSPSIATATPWTCASNQASAIAFSRPESALTLVCIAANSARKPSR